MNGIPPALRGVPQIKIVFRMETDMRLYVTATDPKIGYSWPLSPYSTNTLEIEKGKLYIHFAFGQLAKEGKLDEQLNEFRKKILEKKQLKISECTEFIPRLNNPADGSISIDLTKGTVSNGRVSFNAHNTIKLPSVSYLPQAVPMICFISIPFEKLAASSHSQEYGKLGIVFQEKFYKKHGLKSVIYYDEKSILNDELIMKYRKYNSFMSNEELHLVVTEIITYRKPKTLTENFSKSAAAIITPRGKDTKLSFFTYDRYPIGYDFTTENEHRMAFDKGVDFLPFEEEDVFMIIVPNKESKMKIDQYFHENWKIIPQVEVFPD
jgi:hypothetical protein